MTLWWILQPRSDLFTRLYSNITSKNVTVLPSQQLPALGISCFSFERMYSSSRYSILGVQMSSKFCRSKKLFKIPQNSSHTFDLRYPSLTIMRNYFQPTICSYILSSFKRNHTRLNWLNITRYFNISSCYQSCYSLVRT